MLYVVSVSKTVHVGAMKRHTCLYHYYFVSSGSQTM